MNNRPAILRLRADSTRARTTGPVPLGPVAASGAGPYRCLHRRFAALAAILKNDPAYVQRQNIDPHLKRLFFLLFFTITGFKEGLVVFLLITSQTFFKKILFRTGAKNPDPDDDRRNRCRRYHNNDLCFAHSFIDQYLTVPNQGQGFSRDVLVRCFTFRILQVDQQALFLCQVVLCTQQHFYSLFGMIHPPGSIDPRCKRKYHIGKCVIFSLSGDIHQGFQPYRGIGI